MKYKWFKIEIEGFYGIKLLFELMLNKFMWLGV